LLSEAIEAPVLLTGRGGSGTRLLSQIAAETGIFIGSRINKSGDSTEWVKLIYRIAIETGGERELPAGSRFREDIRAHAGHFLDQDAARHARLWGLKLPETMLVLPLLIDAFPRAKVVHLIRHPISSSLRRTHMTSRLNNPIGAVALPAAYRYTKRDVARIATDDPYLHNAYSWNFQVTRVAHYARESLGENRYFEVAYEDLCTEPSRVVASLRSFLGCGPDVSDTSIPVDWSRIGGWDRGDPRADAIWELCGTTAALLGYRRDRPR
jgi:hypothetical protein